MVAHFAEISPIEVNLPVLVDWESTADNATSRRKATETSLVVGVSTGETDWVPDWVNELLERRA